MLTVTIPEIECFNNKDSTFITIKAQTLQLEHSLVSLSKWEAKWKKPFIGNTEKTYEEIQDYIRCMTITQNVDPMTYGFLPKAIYDQINVYIDEPMTATTFKDEPTGKASREVITSEIIYYWMITLNIPIEFQKWHLNKLLTFIKVCNIKNSPPKKMSLKEQAAETRRLNAERRQKYNTKG